jgi:Tfp pilus assembly protein PilN
MLAAFNGTWDWTAIGTLALAVVTGVSLAFAWGSLKQTQRQIQLGQEQLEQTQREIELSRAEVEEAHRPVLVPFQKSGELEPA